MHVVSPNSLFTVEKHPVADMGIFVQRLAGDVGKEAAGCLGASGAKHVVLGRKTPHGCGKSGMGQEVQVRRRRVGWAGDALVGGGQWRQNSCVSGVKGPSQKEKGKLGRECGLRSVVTTVCSRCQWRQQCDSGVNAEVRRRRVGRVGNGGVGRVSRKAKCMLHVMSPPKLVTK